MRKPPLAARLRRQRRNPPAPRQQPRWAETDREWVERRQAAPEVEEEDTAVFAADDFDRWFLEGGNRSDPVTTKDQKELFDNLMYLTRAEDRRLTQSLPDLRDAIRVWAAAWNETLPAPRQVAERYPRLWKVQRSCTACGVEFDPYDQTVIVREGALWHERCWLVR